MGCSVISYSISYFKKEWNCCSKKYSKCCFIKGCFKKDYFGKGCSKQGYFRKECSIMGCFRINYFDFNYLWMDSIATYMHY